MSNIEQEILFILEQTAKANNLKNYELKPDIQPQLGDGFLSSFYKGDVIDKDTGKSFRVAIKKRPNFEFDYGSIFSNEIHFYTKFLPVLLQIQKEADLPKPFDNTPKYFTSSLDDSKQYLALEHLQPAGYVLHEKKKFLSKDQLRMVFETYGKFHALSFVLKKQNSEKYEDITKDLKDMFYLFTEKEFSKDLIIKTIEGALNNLDEGGAAQEEGKALFKNIISTVEQSLVYNGSYRCLTHGDCWSNNMLFKFHESGKLENMKLLDFQLSRDGTPVHDLSYFFYAAASKEDLDLLEDYLKIYHDSLSEVIKALGEDPEEILPYKILIEEWKNNALMGVILGVYLWLIKLLEKDEYVDMLKDKPGDQQESLDDTTQSITHLMSSILNNDKYKLISRHIFQHAYDFGILTRDKAS